MQPEGMESIEISCAQSNIDKFGLNSMKILLLSALFPPNVIGGAEMSAFNTARLLASKGHEVGVLTTAANIEQECEGKEENGLKIWRKMMPRPYQMMEFLGAKKWKKPLWHIQDHIDPRNRWYVRNVLDQFKPDWININFIQGIGYNALSEVAKYGAPVIYVLPDLGLACVRMSMFKNGHECQQQCMTCKYSSVYKARLISRIPQIGFSSPSQSNIETLSRFFPVKKYVNRNILNPNLYPKPNRARLDSNKFRILYVGRMHQTKGVDLLLEVGSKLAENFQIEFNFVGNGPMLDDMRTKYHDTSWCKIHGFLPQQEIANYMLDSDVMCIPSIWAENSPGVVVHANQIGLPTIGSRKGGIPELIEEGVTGCLVEPGDAEAWYLVLKELIEDPTRVKDWRNNLLERSENFELDSIYRQIVALYETVSGEQVVDA